MELPELILILIIVLVIFGAGKLPQIGDALGKSIRNFKKASQGGDEPIDVTPPQQIPATYAQAPQLPVSPPAAPVPPAASPAAVQAPPTQPPAPLAADDPNRKA